MLDGLEVITDVSQSPLFPLEADPSRGHPLRRLAVRFEGLERTGSDLRFEVVGELDFGRIGDDVIDRASDVARSQLVVRYAIVGTSYAPVSGSVSYRETHYGHGPGAELSVCRPDPANTELTIDGPPGAMAAPGLRSFAIQLFPDDEDEAGDAVHELSILVDPFDHDVATGRATMRVEGYVSNEGPPLPHYPMDYSVEAEVLLLPFDGAGPVDALRFESPIGPGRTELELPLRP